MLVRLKGWSDDDIWQLLTLFQKHLNYYIYGSDSQFAEVVRAELPGKAAVEILEMVRAMMKHFGLRLSTKNFRTDGIVGVHGQEVYVYEHLYESIHQLPENRAGGVWLPAELSRFYQKAKQYRGQFNASQEKYFQKVQLWGKSIAETKSKFYTLRELFIKEKLRPCLQNEMEAKRLELLREIFTDVPPIRQEKKVVAVSRKAPRMWSSEEMKTLVDLVVQITAQIQKTGCSDVVDHVAKTLHRTERSCVIKLTDMREKIMKKASTVRAANMPDTIFDPNSDAHKIFNADWTDTNDPYALGYLALKLRSRRNKKRRTKSTWSSKPSHQIEFTAARDTERASSKLSASSTTEVAAATPIASGLCNSKMQSLRSEESSANQVPLFVKEIAKQCSWTETVVLKVLQGMQHSIELYRSNKIVDFYSTIAKLTSDVEFLDLFAVVQHILTHFEQRYGTLDGFEALVLTAPSIDSTRIAINQETKELDHVCRSDGASPLMMDQLASTNLEESSKCVKHEPYGKSYTVAKKRRLDASTATDDRVDEGYDEEDDEDDLSDDEVSVNAESESLDGESDGMPHPLQSMLASLESHMAELQEKQRVLIKQKEDRERHHQNVKHLHRIRLNAEEFMKS